MTNLHKCRLTNRSMNGHLRTNEMEGECLHPPEPGYRFEMWNSKPLENKAATGRLVTTSTVMSASLDGKNVDFLTETGTNYFWEDLS